MTAIDVLRRAKQLLQSPLPHPWADCQYELGPWCVRCALAAAKSDLDGLPDVEDLPALLEAFVFNTSLPGDAPLVEALQAVRAVMGSPRCALNEGEACLALDLAIAALEAEARAHSS